MTYPVFGALPAAAGVTFRVWAPAAHDLRLVLQGGPASGEIEMTRLDDGLFERIVQGIGAGQRYGYRIDGGAPVPDPASRFQPLGVHSASEVVDPDRFEWHDDRWTGPAAATLVVYELHVGAFTRDGTFLALRDRLGALRDLGVTAIELMPLADFPGARNWGYDGVALFAPSRAYGHPDDLRAVVDTAHRLGLAVLIDVVYNHLGPEGAYVLQFNPQYLGDSARSTPWGRAVNLDGPGSARVRQFIIDNAVHWIREYHADGLRIDASHALIDTSRPHLMRELARTARSETHRTIVLHAEDHRNLSSIVRDNDEDSWGFDGIWADDFHHIVRRIVAGDARGYYADFEGSTSELARTITQGWLFTGELSRHLGVARGTDPSSVPMQRSIVCVQNHDQIGNRAFGDRLHHQVDSATWRAVSTVLLTAPMTPLLFMGQEWAASTPFQYFTDLNVDLGRLVTEGRRLEFKEFPEFSEPSARASIPDPQSPSTFDDSRLNWGERGDPRHAEVLRLYRALLALRREYPALGASAEFNGEAVAPDTGSLVVRRRAGAEDFRVIARLRGEGTVTVATDDCAGEWQLVLSTEEPQYAHEPQTLAVHIESERIVVDFKRPAAVVMRMLPAAANVGAEPRAVAG